MTEGTSQGLFVVVAIVIFGIFVGLSYLIFGDTLNPALADMFTKSTEQATNDLNKENSKPEETKVVDAYASSIFTYDFFENTATITGFEIDKSQTSIVIPHIVEKDGVNYPVTIIGAGAFKSSVKEVTIPDSVLIIERDAFRNNKLIDVVIPDSVVSIGTQAFFTSTIKTLTLGNSVEKIDGMAFFGTEIEEIYFPDSIRTLGSQAFDYTPLKQISIPKSDILTPDKIRWSSAVPDETQINVR